MATALIDADVVAYTVGFASQDTEWEVTSDGETLYRSAKKEDCLTFIESEGRNYDITPVIIPDELRNALHTCKMMMKRIKEGAGCTTYRPYLTGKGNFRERIATLQKYKGNRIAEKPYHFEDIRRYILEHHRGVLVDGMEADDAISIVHTRAMREGRRTVICSVDKDFDQIVGPHYYFKKDQEEYYEVSNSEANRAFWKQVLTGDRVDNIQGVPGLGNKKAAKVLDAVEPKDYEATVLKAYRDKFGEIHQYHHWCDTDKKLLINATPEALLIENARLLYLLREKPLNGMINLWRPSWLNERETLPLKASGRN